MVAPPRDALRIAVVGAGAFGRNHLRVYRELEREGAPIHLAAVVDPDPDARQRAAAEFGVAAFATVADCLHRQPVAAASLCAPTVAHAPCARTLLHAGVDLLVEKPLAATLAEAEELVALAASAGRVLQPGHLERFNPAVRAVLPLTRQPMFFEVHRLSVFTSRSLDVDVVLDLMIHDLDLVLTLVGAPVRELRAVGLPVLSDRVDIANVRLEFATGCVANLTASRVSTERVRKMRFFQPHQYLSLDFARQDLLLIDVAAAARELARLPPEAAAQLADAAAGGHPSPGMSLRKVPVELGEPLKFELAAFIQAVRSRTQPVVTPAQGRDALALALQINAAIASHAQRTGLSAR